MKKIIIIFSTVLMSLVLATSVFAISYCQDFLEPGNPGGRTTGLKTCDTINPVTVNTNDTFTIDIWATDMPESLISSGFEMAYNPAQVSIVSVQAYDGVDIAGGPWDGSATTKIPDPYGPGSYVLAVLQLNCVVPDAGGDVIIAKVTFQCLAGGSAAITIKGITDFPTTVGCITSTEYDPQMGISTITISQSSIDFCEGNFDCDVDVDGTDASRFKSDFGRTKLLNPCPTPLDNCPSDPWAPCPEGMVICSNACVDPMTDEAHCGGCNVTCSGTCVAGVCQQANPLPDLIIHKMYMDPIQPMQGQTVTIWITVKNQGQADSGPCWLDWYQSLAVPPIPGQGGNQYFYIGSLAPSATYTALTTGSVSFDGVGDFNMYAQVDSFADVTESIEDNNVYGPYGVHVAEGCVGTLSALGRWCDQGDGTVKDMTTGLVWLKKADWGGQYPLWADYGSPDAHHRAASLWDGSPDEGTAGLSDGSVEGDWRLPTKTELVGITVGDEYIRSSSMYLFTGVQSVLYWSGTSYASNPMHAWDVGMGNGIVDYYFKGAYNYVWPVRSDN